MLTILIVDDEREELEGISFLIDKLGFQLNKVFANNGNQALEYLVRNKVDILFTDIRMPMMDGLELIKLAKKEKPDLKIIIYSGYADFAYAQSAINLEVLEYILKPIRVEEFEKALKRVMEKVRHDESEHELYSKTARYAQNHLLYKALNYSDSLSEVDTKLLENFDICYTKLFLLEFDQSFFDIISFHFEDWIAEVIPCSFDYLNLNVSQCLLLFKCSEQDIQKSFYEIAVDLHNKIEGALGYTCYIALSSEGNESSSLAEKFAQLERLMEYRFFASYTRIFEEEDLLEEMNTPSSSDTLILDKIKKEVSVKDFNKINMYIDLLFQKYQNKTNYSQLYVKFVFSTLYHTIITEFVECSESEINLYIDKLYRCTDLLELKSILQNTLQEFEKREESNDDVWHDIDLVKKYVEKHFQEDLNLYSLAEKVYLSPSYLCARFKRITGFGINKYIKNVRMERAEQLVVNTNMKIIDICEQVGYHNLSYFCQSYKEHFGKTPEKYRQHNVKEYRIAEKIKGGGVNSVDKISRFFNDMSFRNKILTAFIFIALIPLSVLGVFSYKTIRSMLINKEMMYLESTFAQTSQVLHSRISTYDNVIRSLCFNRQLISLNQMIYESDYDRYESLNFIDDLFVTTKNLVPGVEYITLFTNSNMGIHGNTVRPIDEIKSFEWYTAVSDTATSWLYDGSYIFCVHPMLDSAISDRNRSYIVMQIKVEAIEEILRSVDAQNISVVIWSEENGIVSNNGNTQNVHEVIDQIPSLNELYIDNNKFISIKDHIKGTSWMMVMSASYKEIIMSTYLFSVTVIIIILSCFLVVFVVSIWFSRKMLVRIYQLKRNMAEVEEGAFVVNVESSSKDEIGELIRGFSAMIVKINDLIEKNYKATVEKKDYELKALQAQINPHFLYNSLSLINWRALRIDAPEISELARLLSDFYRTTLNKGNSVTIVMKEILNIKSYLQIQQIMHNDSFSVEYQIEDIIGNCLIPNLTLQPLVENAIVHGFEKMERPGKLTITAMRNNDDIHIVIKDNGVGIPAESLNTILQTESQEGYGLKNVNQRIKLIFGEEYGMSIESVVDEGTVVTVKIPAQYGKNYNEAE